MSKVLQIAAETLKVEADSILKLIPRLNSNFEKAVAAIIQCKGKIILTGIGKSGQVARKIASTLSSTGSPAIFLHPAESSHGDLGVIAKNDLVIALSYGGEAAELNPLIKWGRIGFCGGSAACCAMINPAARWRRRAAAAPLQRPSAPRSGTT